MFNYRKLDILLGSAIDKDNVLSYQTISDKEFEEYVKGDYSDAFIKYRHGNRIYRGINDYSGNMAISTPKYRTSEPGNIHTRLFSSILPSWSKYPKRNHCFIATSSLSYAQQFTGNEDDVFALLPKNSTELAICPAKDLWYSFKKVLGFDYSADLRKFNDSVKSLFKEYSNPFIDKKAVESNDKEFIDYLNTIDAEIADRALKNNQYSCLYKILKLVNKGSTFIDALDNLMSPDNNGFKLVNINEYALTTRINKEIWFDNTAIFIKETAIKSYLRLSSNV